MTVGVDNTFRLLQQILVNLLSATQSDAMIGPRRTLRLQIEAHLIGSSKGRLGWTIAVESHVVQAIGLTLPEDLQPRLLIHRGITRLGEATVLYRSAQPDGSVVDIDLSSLHADIPHTEGGLVIVAAHTHTDAVDLREKFIPDSHLMSQRHHEGRLGLKYSYHELSHHRIGLVVGHNHDMHIRIILV